MGPDPRPRRPWSKAICWALLSGLVAAPALADPLDDVSKLFGPRVQASSRFKAPFATGDFDGDGKPDALYLVTILPASAQDGQAGDVTVVGTLFGREPLGAGGETLALAIVQASGKGKFLLTGYQGEGVTDYFGSPIWSDPSPPVGVAKRGSKVFDGFRHQEPKIKDDIVVVGTEAGIDTALYWDGRGYALFQPVEEP